MKKISFQEHQIIGLISKILNYKLFYTIPDYKTKVEMRKCHHIKAEKFLSNFRNQMEGIMFIDYPSATTDVYYGNRPQDEEIIKAILKMIKEFENGK